MLGTGPRGTRLSHCSVVADLRPVLTLRRAGVEGVADLAGHPVGVLQSAMSIWRSSGELVLLGGGQGLGKTTFALQVMRNLVACLFWPSSPPHLVYNLASASRAG